MTLRHSRDPSSRRSSSKIAPHDTYVLPPHLRDPTLPNDAFPPVPPKNSSSKRRCIGNKNTLLRMPSLNTSNGKRHSSHEKGSHRLGRATRKYRTTRGHKSVSRDHIRWGGNTVGNEPGDDRLRADSGLNPQPDRRSQLAGTGMAEDQLQLQRGRDRAQQHGRQQRRRSSVQHWRLLWCR